MPFHIVVPDIDIIRVIVSWELLEYMRNSDITNTSWKRILEKCIDFCIYWTLMKMRLAYNFNFFGGMIFTNTSKTASLENSKIFFFFKVYFKHRLGSISNWCLNIFPDSIFSEILFMIGAMLKWLWNNDRILLDDQAISFHHAVKLNQIFERSIIFSHISKHISDPDIKLIWPIWIWALSCHKN